MFKNFLNSIKAVFLGMFTVLSHLFKRPVTEEYPEEMPVLNNNFRGIHILKNCRGCGYCQKVCPTDAITIIKKENILEKYLIDLSKCIFCGNCEYYCPTKSMKMTDRFELAQCEKSGLVIEIENMRT